MKHKILADTNQNVLGLVIAYNQAADTSEVMHAIVEAMEQCGYQLKMNFFKDEIYEMDNFQKLYQLDRVFFQEQKSITNLNNLLVVNLQYIVKQNNGSGKNSVGMTCNARWLDLKNFVQLHEFYYAEVINAPDPSIGILQMQQFLGTQIYLKLCLDIGKFIPKKN